MKVFAGVLVVLLGCGKQPTTLYAALSTSDSEPYVTRDSGPANFQMTLNVSEVPPSGTAAHVLITTKQPGISVTWAENPVTIFTPNPDGTATATLVGNITANDDASAGEYDLSVQVQNLDEAAASIVALQAETTMKFIVQ